MGQFAHNDGTPDRDNQRRGRKGGGQMGKTVTYKEYTLQAAPRHMADTGQWELNVFISWTMEGEEESRHFYLVGRYATEEEATSQCIAYGQQIIDGKIPGSSVG